MINNNFWKDAASVWSWDAKPDIKVAIGSGGKIDETLLKKPWEMLDKELVDFDDIDYEASAKTVRESGNVVLKENEVVDEEVSRKISLDMDKFDEYMEQESLSGFVLCFRLLRDCGFPDSITEKLKEMESRMVTLENSVDKFKKVYEADLTMFMESYIPEALNLSVGYIEYVNAKVSEEVLLSTQREIEEAMDTLIIGVNGKIDEIHKFASIELKAAAKALNATLNAEGYVDTKYKL